MNKDITKLIAIATIVLIPVVSFAQSTTPASSPASVPVSKPTSGTSLPTGNPTAGTAPSAGNPTAGTAPSAGGPTAGVTPTVGQSTAGTSAPSNPTPAPAANDSSTGPSGSGSRARNSGTSYGCPMITSFMKYGANNDTVQVTKLQNFLKNVEKIDVDVNGIFDKKTESAVIAFQNKYNPTIMGPWGATKGTGFVYITTVKQINKITCSLPLTLNASEIAIINATRDAKVASTKTVTITPKETPASIEIEVSGTEDNTITFESENETIEENVATVGKASIMSRFWDFMVYLFK